MNSIILKAPQILAEEGILKDHAILVEEERIRQILPKQEIDSKGNCLELPNTILLPGLINCHTHLELSELPEPLPYPGSFAAWIDLLSQLKLKMSPQRISEGIQKGVEQLILGGTTTIADHMSLKTSPKTLLDSPLEGVIYLEVLGLEENRALAFYEEALRLEKQNKNGAKMGIVATPHAPYSLLPEFASKIAASTLSKSYPLSVHIAESFEEYQLFKERRGSLFDFLQTRGKLPPTDGETPLHYMQRLNLLNPQMMAIHGNYLEDNDAEILKKWKMSVIHCPGSHAYFEQDRFPLGLLDEAGILVALGTDSLASNETLNMLEQMRLVLKNYSELTPKRAFEMATQNGAHALKREKEIGTLKAGKLANIIGIPNRYPKKNIYENILFSDKAQFSMIRGKVIEPIADYCYTSGVG